MFFHKHVANQNYDIGMIRIDGFAKYCVLVHLNEKEHALALCCVESLSKAGGGGSDNHDKL